MVTWSWICPSSVKISHTSDRKILWKCAYFAILWRVRIETNIRTFCGRTMNINLFWDRMFFSPPNWALEIGAFGGIYLSPTVLHFVLVFSFLFSLISFAFLLGRTSSPRVLQSLLFKSMKCSFIQTNIFWTTGRKKRIKK